MAMPDLKYIFYIGIFNIFMFILSYSLQSFFSGGAFVTGVDGELMVDLTMPIITGVGLLESITNIINFLVDAVGIFISIMSFDIENINWMVRLMIVAPLWIANIYIIFSVLLEIGAIIADIIPFT